METVKDINLALSYLKNKNILMTKIDSNIHYFAYRNKNISVFNDNVSYSITEKDFAELFSKYDFYIYERNQDSTIDPLKDVEYYSWRQ